MDRDTIIQLRQAYDRGENITSLMRAKDNRDTNSVEAIEIAYDLQTGSYIAGLSDPAMAQYLSDYSAELARRIDGLDVGQSILDVGTGEGTTFAAIVDQAGWRDKSLAAFDVSWSRTHFASQYLRTKDLSVTLCTADIAQIPFATSSVDTVIASHALEPNGGRERELLSELYRVCARYLILLEPSDELGSDATRERMKKMGYISGLRRHAESLGLKVIRHELMDTVVNPANQTALLVIEKGQDHSAGTFEFTSPGSDEVLLQTPSEDGGFLFSRDEGLAFSRLGGIPHLRRSHAVLASKYGEQP